MKNQKEIPVDAETIKAILNKADPNKNSSVHERQNALRMAEREMDKSGLSFASLGFSQEDAERIANQFSVAAPGASNYQREARGSFSIFRPRANDIERSTQRQSRSTPARKPAATEEPGESFEDQCLRREREASDRQYNAWAQWRTEEDVREAQSQQAGKKAFFIILGIVAFVLGIVLFSAITQNAALWTGIEFVFKVFAGIAILLAGYFVFWILRPE